MRRGWFKIPGVQDGDRTLDQQLRGLGPLVVQVRGKSVADFGCAEGLIAKHLLEAGARSVVGYEVVADHIVEANRQCADFIQSPPLAKFFVQDLNAPKAMHTEKVDVAVLLAVLHKLRQPGEFLHFVVEHFEPELMVIRTAGATPGYIKDPRSGKRMFRLHDLLHARYALEAHHAGPFDEWTGYYRIK